MRVDQWRTYIACTAFAHRMIGARVGQGQHRQHSIGSRHARRRTLFKRDHRGLRGRRYEAADRMDETTYSRSQRQAPRFPALQSSSGDVNCRRPRVPISAAAMHSGLTDLTTRIDPYSVVIGLARRSEFLSELACPLEGFLRITRRERHGCGYVRKASASRGGKHR